MDITGILKVKGQTQQVSEKFKKREIVVTDNSSQYPQHISFQLTQDKCSIIDNYNVGDEIKVHFNLRGREWTSPQGETKYFNSLEAWRIEGNASAVASNNSGAGMNDVAATFTAASQEDDLPF
ncbi:MAG: DUF3127 domain-containing protein [Bacteroidetes bacterium]|nr:DUF3127 domain-containing protein [Bacteroidota bacterium]